MNNCKDCINSIFDERMGEYKCKVLGRRVYILLEPSECPSYGKDPKKTRGAERNERRSNLRNRKA